MNACVIHASLAPTTGAEDVLASLACLVTPTRWLIGSHVEQVRNVVGQQLGVASDRILLLDSGRHALAIILKALNLGPKDTVFLQAYTCVSVPGPILWAGGTPVYVDIIPQTFNMDPAHLEERMQSCLRAGQRPRVLIIQHTFGLPADLGELLAVARAHNLVVIEDCAHALGATYRGGAVGTFGDAAIFSFGRDKIISSVFGGGLVVNQPALQPDVERQVRALKRPSRAWVAQKLLHPPLAYLCRQSYWAGGRYALRAFQAVGMLSKAISATEKLGERPAWPPTLFSNALAALAERQLNRLSWFFDRRQALARHYSESLRDLTNVELPFVPQDRTHLFLRYAIRVSSPAVLHRAARGAGIILGDWYDHVIAPAGTVLNAMGYQNGSCPRAEEAARHTVNLPTSPTLGIPEADRVIHVVRSVPNPPA